MKFLNKSFFISLLTEKCTYSQQLTVDSKELQTFHVQRASPLMKNFTAPKIVKNINNICIMRDYTCKYNTLANVMVLRVSIGTEVHMVNSLL